MKSLGFTLIILVIFMMAGASAQSPDSFIVESSGALPGDTAIVSLYLHNTQFSVAGFTMRFVLLDSVYANFTVIDRGSAVLGFEYFNVNISDGTCRIAGIADLPGGGNPPLLPLGYHELARVAIAINGSAPAGNSDSILFVDDGIPPDRDNSISDSTGYINEVPTLVNGIVYFEIESGLNDNPLEMPLRVELFQNYPNPFNAETRIGFILANSEENVKLDIYDLLGKNVKNFFWDALTAGNHNVVWDGRNRYGDPLSSGVYFYRLETYNAVADYMKMTLLK